MLALLRRDPLISSQSLKVGVFVAANAAVIAGLVAFLAASAGAGSIGPFRRLAFLAIPIWLSISPFLLIGRVGERCLPLDMALPLSARRLWLAHVIALMLFGLGLLALTGGILQLFFRLLQRAPQESSAFPEAFADLVLPMSAGLVLVVVLHQCVHPSLCRIPRTRQYILYSILVVCIALGLILALALLPPLAAVVPLALALWIGYRTYRSVPPAFTLVPREACPGDAAAAPAPSGTAVEPAPLGDLVKEAEAGSAGSVVLGRLLFRVLYGKFAHRTYAFYGFYPLLFFLGVIFSGFMALWRDMELPQLLWLFLTAYFLLSFLPVQMVQLQFLSPLPISRTRLLSLLMLPGLLAIFVGYGAGSAGKAFIQSSRLMIKYQEESSSLLPTYPSDYPVVRVPAQYFEIAWDGNVPENGSPWGESHPARKDPLYSGSRIVLYSPFSTPRGCTPQFVAHQISKAIQVIYGTTVPYQQVLERYLEIKDNVCLGLKDGGAPILRDYPNLIPVRDIPLFPLIALVIGGTWLLMAALYFRTCRATVSDAGRKAVYFALLAVVLMINTAPVPALILGFFRLEVVDAFLRILIRQAVDFLPGGVLTVWVLSAGALAGAYQLAKALFGRIELIPGRPCR